MSRTSSNPGIQRLAQRLAAFDGAGNGASAFRVIERLRMPLGTLAGTAGFRSLLARSLTLAKAKDPRLSAMEVKPDGALEGIHFLGDNEAGVVLAAELLGLLEAFIGETLMLSIVLDVWPEFPVSDTDTWKKGPS